MNSNNKINQNNGISNRMTPIAIIPMVGAIVTAVKMLSGLSLIASFQQTSNSTAREYDKNMTGAVVEGKCS
ncbi:MAG: hypothetical protein M3115_05885 [Thermoproteota archaeon]|nr:hypothetical protein [Thermoproteota archaeon]